MTSNALVRLMNVSATFVLLLTILLELPEDKDHVCSAFLALKPCWLSWRLSSVTEGANLFSSICAKTLLFHQLQLPCYSSVEQLC